MWKYNQNELYHHGVRGMRWGVRRNRDRGSHGGSKRSRSSYDERAYSRLGFIVNKTRSQQKLEQDYLDQGYSRKDAARQAYEKDRAIRQYKSKGILYDKDDLDAMDYEDKIIDNRLLFQNKKSKLQNKLEGEYTAQGLTKKEAARRAYETSKQVHAYRASAAAMLALGVGAAVVESKSRSMNNNPFAGEFSGSSSLNSLIGTAALAAGMAAFAGRAARSSTKYDNQSVVDYRKKKPKSKESYNQIILKRDAGMPSNFG